MRRSRFEGASMHPLLARSATVAISVILGASASVTACGDDPSVESEASDAGSTPDGRAGIERDGSFRPGDADAPRDARPGAIIDARDDSDADAGPAADADIDAGADAAPDAESGDADAGPEADAGGDAGSSALACATDNGGCGSAAFWRCTEVAGGPPVCSDIDECLTNNGGCGNPTFTSCVNNPGAPPTCGDVNECQTANGGCGNPAFFACTNNASAAPTCTPTGSITDWTAVVAGQNHTCALKAAGQLWCWGANESGQLGLGSISTTNSFATRVGSGTDWTAVAGGAYHSCGLRGSGEAWCWGQNVYGQVGTAGAAGLTPTRVGTAADWTAISTGGAHTCGLRAGGELWCWGRNNNGQLGDGTPKGSHANASAPLRVGTASIWKDVSAGNAHTCAVTSTGELWCWGDDTYGELGVGGTTERERATPTRVGTASDWLAVSAGGLFTCGRKGLGELWCWGNNNNGNLGLGSVASSNVPLRAGVESDWTTVTSGAFHACGLQTPGALWCWGLNNAGQVGDGTVTTRTAPVAIGASTSWTVVSAGSSHSCGRNGAGEIWCWGENARGQLGDGTVAPKRAPAQVR